MEIQSLVKAEGNPNFRENTLRLDYKSKIDGAADWAFVEPSESKTWMICLHGHGSHGDQLYTRQDIV
ncbi:MAG: hypothetical protein ACYTFY_19125, partial [Planctomycetota bacterium]